MRLIDADAFREDYALAERCEDCRRYGKKDCDYPCYSARDFCGWLDDAPTVGGWISVKDRLPENQDTVLIVKQLKSGIRQIGLGYCIKEHPRHDYQTGEDVVEPYWVCGGNNNIIWWMPLPEMPEVER